jgi:ABC-type transport system involved in multi-copper enzyme maturation permease subunit
MSSHAISPYATLRAVGRGYLPRLLQPRGWVLCALAVLPVLLSLAGHLVSSRLEGFNDRVALQVFHGVLVSFILPIMALVAAPGGIREDLEQRTLPLILARPVTVWALPAAKGLLWYGWGALWLLVGCAGLLPLGAEPAPVAWMGLALVLAFWAELALMSLLGLVFKRGTLWGALILFGWENLLRILPATLQRFTLLHHIESISGSRGGAVANYQILAQEQISSPVWVSAAVLILFGCLCWALAGWNLQRTPVGLAGNQGEG